MGAASEILNIFVDLVFAIHYFRLEWKVKNRFPLAQYLFNNFFDGFSRQSNNSCQILPMMCEQLGEIL